MKKTLLFLALLLCAFFSNAQTYLEDFESTPVNSIPNDWQVSSNTKVNIYNRPNFCSVDNKGLLTPGVGKTAPVRLILPSLVYNNTIPSIIIDFKVFVYNANLNCANAQVTFPCSPVLVKAYIVVSTFTDLTKDPTPTDIIAVQPDYQIVNANDNNTILFNNLPSTFLNGTNFRILLDFKAASSTCVSGNTKFVFDDFNVGKPNCPTCIPVANSDYFDASTSGFVNSLKANLYGGYANWSTTNATANPDYTMNSLSTSPAVNNGLDYDPNNTALGSMTYNLVANSLTLTSTCPGTNLTSFTLFSDGRIFVDRGSNTCISRVVFQYTITNNLNSQSSSVATVTIDFPPNSPLPVSLKSFSATRNNKNVSLKWETASEQNNKGFYVQRSLPNGTWQDVAFVFSQAEHGNSSTALSYSLNDLNINKGISQYRLLQVDVDGHGKYSEVRSVRGEEMAARLLVFPNPSSTGTINILFDDASAPKDVMVSDLAGRLVKQYSNVSGSLEVKKLKSGFYTIRVLNRSTGAALVEKIIVNER